MVDSVKRKVVGGFPKIQKSKRKKKSNKHKAKETIQRGNVPLNLKSRLLAPTEREYEPKARIHDRLGTSQTDRSYLESVTFKI